MEELNGSFVWLHGLPSCAKTVLCSSTIEEAVAECSLRPNYHLVFFYWSRLFGRSWLTTRGTLKHRDAKPMQTHSG